MKYSGTIRFVVALGAAIAISTSVALRAEDPKETPIQGTIRLSNTQDREIALVESAKISIQQAITAALSRDNGAVQRVELQNEDGFLVYNVELVSADKKLHEVKVDAGNGNILRVDLDTTDREKNEEHENGEQND
jgi:uncharacterized membrane protein YkoI